MKRLFVLLLMAALVAYAGVGLAAERIKLATTTSTQSAGLLDVLLPAFTKTTDITVDVIAVGTGKALELGKNCDVDVVLVHAPAAELKWVEAGYGIERTPLMHNFFIVVGPVDDPAKIKEAKSMKEVLTRIKDSGAIFVSRGDDSGTHKKELALWKEAGLQHDWAGYREAGQGMGPVLTMASELKGYTLSDSATFLKMKSSGKSESELLYAQDDALRNDYAVMLVNPEKCPKVKTEPGRKFMQWLAGPEGQKMMADYQINNTQMFWPDVIK